MDELVAWLREQLDDDQEMASKAVEYRRFPTYGELDRSLTPRVRGHIARWEPARVLAEVEAKRRIIDRCLEGIAEDEWVRNLSPLAEGVILHLAQPYADRPGFKDEWRLT